MEDAGLKQLRDAVHHQGEIGGLTHNLYRYPARFSPEFASAVINALTKPGDLVLDPFMGSGTTLVESNAAGRVGFGVDINSLAVKLARIKTRTYSEPQLQYISEVGYSSFSKLRVTTTAPRPLNWISRGYLRNLDSQDVWRIRKLLELGIIEVRDYSSWSEDLLRCALLRTGQWALDCRKNIPSPSEFRSVLLENLDSIINDVRQFTRQVKTVNSIFEESPIGRVRCIEGSSADMSSFNTLVASGIAPRLVLTSPPYPGVHVLYHRWQIKGRRETPAPYWIANCEDGKGASYYTLGPRHEQDLSTYYTMLEQCFSNIAKISDSATIIVQLVAFQDIEAHLPLFLEALQRAGLEETSLSPQSGRYWRDVPNRRWYSTMRNEISTNKEVLLIHRLKCKD